MKNSYLFFYKIIVSKTILTTIYPNKLYLPVSCKRNLVIAEVLSLINPDYLTELKRRSEASLLIIKGTIFITRKGLLPFNER